MVTIGGKSRKPKAPTKPQIVIQRALGINEYALFGIDDSNQQTLNWTGDPNAASKFNSKYEAKNRTRSIEDIPDGRVFKVLEPMRA